MVRACVKTIWVLVLVLTVVLTAAGAVAAQEGEDDDDDEGQPFTHPVAALIESYFGIEAGQVITLQGQGIGLGEQVKLYALAAQSGVPVEELIAAFQAGTGLGELFKQYGRPSILGVGHLRGNGHRGPDHAGPGEGADEDDAGGGPPPHARPHGNRNPGPPDHARAGGQNEGGE